MTRALAIAALLLTLAPAGAAADQRAAGKARLQIVQGPSLVVRGTRFVAGERIRIVVRGAHHRLSKQARADRRGAFLVRFQFSRDRCNGILIASATGSRGSAATAKTPPQPMCPPRL